jgi:hypothetical protein
MNTKVQSASNGFVEHAVEEGSVLPERDGRRSLGRVQQGEVCAIVGDINPIALRLKMLTAVARTLSTGRSD